MSISVYCGLQGSGKSYGVVSEVIVPAVAKGRRVVTNVDGIDPEKVRAYASKKFKVPLEKCGEVVVVTTERIMAQGFFPVDADANEPLPFDVPEFVPERALRFYCQLYKIRKEEDFSPQLFALMVPELRKLHEGGWHVGACLVAAAVQEWKTFKFRYFVENPKGQDFCPLPEDKDAFVKGGDLCAFDESWKIWGSAMKLSAEHMSFVRMHRHYVSDAGVSCDICLMSQDIKGLNGFVVRVVQNTFMTHKARGLGFKNLYSVTMWEGTRLTKKLIVKDWTKFYDKQIFPLYKSYAAAQAGSEMGVDGREKFFDRAMMVKIVLLLVMVGYCAWWLVGYYQRGRGGGLGGQSSTGLQSLAPPGQPGSVQYASPAASAVKLADPEVLVLGHYTVNGVHTMVLQGGNVIHQVQAAGWIGYGLRYEGTYEGKRVRAEVLVPAGPKSGVMK